MGLRDWPWLHLWRNHVPHYETDRMSADCGNEKSIRLEDWEREWMREEKRKMCYTNQIFLIQLWFWLTSECLKCIWKCCGSQCWAVAGLMIWPLKSQAVISSVFTIIRASCPHSQNRCIRTEKDWKERNGHIKMQIHICVIPCLPRY